MYRLVVGEGEGSLRPEPPGSPQEGENAESGWVRGLAGKGKEIKPMDYGTYNRWLDHVHETGESLEDVIGYFENYNDDDSSVSEAGPQKKSEMLVAIGMVFKSDTIYAFARPEDDSLYIYHGSEWKPDAGLRMKSLIDRNPWKPAKGKPVMWTWIMYNQQ